MPKSWLLPLLLLTSSCAGGHADSCSWVKPIYVAKQDLSCMTLETKREILSHDETWLKLNQ